MTELKRIDPAETAKLWEKHGIKPCRWLNIEIDEKGIIHADVVGILIVDALGIGTVRRWLVEPGNRAKQISETLSLDLEYLSGLANGFLAEYGQRRGLSQRHMTGAKDGSKVLHILESQGRM